MVIRRSGKKGSAPGPFSALCPLLSRSSRISQPRGGSSPFCRAVTNRTISSSRKACCVMATSASRTITPKFSTASIFPHRCVRILERPASTANGTRSTLPGSRSSSRPPSRLFGYPGVVVFLSLIAAAGSWLLWRASFQLTGSAAAAWFAWAAGALTVPFFFQAFSVYPDGLGATLVLFAALPLVEEGVSKRRWIAVGAALAWLPWLHTRFAIISALLGTGAVSAADWIGGGPLETGCVPGSPCGERRRLVRLLPDRLRAVQSVCAVRWRHSDERRQHAQRGAGVVIRSSVRRSAECAGLRVLCGGPVRSGATPAASRDRADGSGSRVPSRSVSVLHVVGRIERAGAISRADSCRCWPCPPHGCGRPHRTRPHVLLGWLRSWRASSRQSVVGGRSAWCARIQRS